MPCGKREMCEAQLSWLVRALVEWLNEIHKKTPLPPLWTDFSELMKKKLYPELAAPSDPLKLAQEYRAALGDAALHGLIRSLVPDDQWQPGQLHELLLSLPWSDVLTTNWDTLLERVELIETERAYEVVRTTDDISRTRSPRIIKLHGSLPANLPLIFTEEDYRTYPRKFAPFVNLAQQVLLENELCLIGFSGDDPNFLQWCGWVRDNLSEAARQIRLVGVLDLSPSRREMLRQQNVTPIDLAPLVASEYGEDKHRVALSMFLESLNEAEPAAPSAWVREAGDANLKSKHPELKATDLTASWKRDRLAYPGWLVAPAYEQMRVRLDTDTYYPNLKKLFDQCEDASQRIHFLYELTWRHQVSFWPLTDFALTATRKEFTNGNERFLLKEERLGLCSFFLSDARRRWHDDDFTFWANKLQAIDSPGSVLELHYAQALKAKQEFDYQTLSQLVPQIKGDDPVWAMRQGMLYSFLHQSKEAVQCFEKALLDIRKRRAKDRDSIWLLSREAWSLWVYNTVDLQPDKLNGKSKNRVNEWPVRFIVSKSDPWQYIHFIEIQTSQYLAKRRTNSTTKSARFDAGYYQSTEHSRTYTSHTVVSAFDLLTRLQEEAGIPARLEWSDLLNSRLTGALEAYESNGDRFYFWAARQSSDLERGIIDVAFSRIGVARMPLDIVQSLTDRLRKSVDYFLQIKIALDGDHHRVVSEVQQNIELISRLSVRLPASAAEEIFKWAVSLAHSNAVVHWWLYKQVGNLLQRSLEAIPPENRKNFSEQAIFLPLPGEKNNGGNEEDWPELITHFKTSQISRPTEKWKWSERISTLIRYVRSGSPLDRSRSLLRLQALYAANALEAQEVSDFADAIWAHTNPTTGFPEAHRVRNFIFLDLPEKVPGAVVEIFLSSVVDVVADGKIDGEIMANLRGALKASKHLLAQSKEKFPRIFNVCLQWQPPAEVDFNFSLIEETARYIEFEIAMCLDQAVLPSLDVEHVSCEMKEAWRGRVQAERYGSFVMTAYHLVRLFPDCEAEVIRAIRKAIYSGDDNRVYAGLYAIQRMAENTQVLTNTAFNLLVSSVVSICEAMKEPCLDFALTVATDLVRRELVNKSEADRLAESLEPIWENYSYQSNGVSDDRAIALPLVRAQSVRLAEALEGRVSDYFPDQILEQAKEDPMPEVRFAIV